MQDYEILSLICADGNNLSFSDLSAQTPWGNIWLGEASYKYTLGWVKRKISIAISFGLVGKGKLNRCNEFS